MADYVLICEGATSAPGTAGVLADTCTAAGGSLAWSGNGSLLPDLTLAEGGAIATAFLGLWAMAWAIRAIRKVVEET